MFSVCLLQVAREIVSTEETYVKSLKVLSDLYINPLIDLGAWYQPYAAFLCQLRVFVCFPGVFYLFSFDPACTHVSYVLAFYLGFLRIVFCWASVPYSYEYLGVRGAITSA